MNDIDAVIVHYSSVKDLSNCLRALECERLASVTIVDNASPLPIPREVESRPHTRVVRLVENVGFGRGVNIGVKEGRAPFVLIVNPDVCVREGTLSTLRSVLDGTDEIVAVAPRLLLESGEPQVGAAGCFPTYGAVTAHCFPALRWLPVQWAKRPLFHRENGGQRQPPSMHEETDWISGACLLVKRDAFEAVGGFDKRFFMYGEDIDLCRRFAQQKWRVRYCTEVAVVHLQRALGPEWIDGLDEYYRIHSPRARRALHGILALGLGARALGYTVGIGATRSGRPGAGGRMAQYAWHAARHVLGP